MLNQIRCPYCMEIIDLSNSPIYCENCGKDISDVYHHCKPNVRAMLPTAAYHGGNYRKTDKPCPHCQKPVDHSEYPDFCNWCGGDLSVTEQPQKVPERKEPIPRPEKSKPADLFEVPKMEKPKKYDYQK